MAAAVPIVDYLVLGDDPHLVAKECTGCGARFFDRRNACASCSGVYSTISQRSSSMAGQRFTNHRTSYGSGASRPPTQNGQSVDGRLGRPWRLPTT